MIAGLDRDHVERQVAVGLAHARAGHADLAVLTLGNALERTPDQPLIYGALGQVWLDIAQARNDGVALSKALEALARVASSNAATSEVLTLYGRALLQDDQNEAAERALQAGHRALPGRADGVSLLRDGRRAPEPPRERAAGADSIHRARGRRREYVPHATRIATLSLRLNDVGTAIEWLQKTASASPNDVRILGSLADAQIRYGDYTAAKATIAKGLEKDPQNASLARPRPPVP